MIGVLTFWTGWLVLCLGGLVGLLGSPHWIETLLVGAVLFVTGTVETIMNEGS